MSTNLTQKAYLHIHDKLSRGLLQPGSRLSNRGVAREVGISFTPVREALSRLVSEGLLEYRQGVGVFVPIINAQDIQESYEMREILESEVAARVAQNPPPPVLREMAEWHERMVNIAAQLSDDECVDSFDSLVSAWQAADSAFHMTLIIASGNPYLVNLLGGLQTSMKARMISTTQSMADDAQRSLNMFEPPFSTKFQNQMKRVLEEHHSILEALKQNNSKVAKATLAKHVRTGLKEALDIYRRNRMSESNSCLRGSHAY